jgi:signal transduction histidine kinase
MRESLTHRGIGVLGAAALAVGLRAAARQRARVMTSERRQRAILDALEEGVLLVERDGTVASANPSAQRLLDGGMLEGRSDMPFTAVRPDGSVLSDDERPARVAARTGEPLTGIELGLRRPDESMLWLRVSAIPLPSGPRDTGPYPVVVSFADVTAARAGLQALERSNAELRQFAYVASHDLSEPLRMVTSYLQLLRRRYGDGRLGGDADEFIGHAVDGAMRMRELIEDLLSYSRAGRSAAPRPVDCQDLVAAVLSDLETAVERADARVEVGELPAVLGDRMQLRQVFQNLLANALKFRSGPGVRVWVQASRSACGWSFTVADDGIGIPPEQQERVFEMFQRLHGRDDYEGTGIGLAICRKIVEHHGGSIAACGRPGGGTAFRFELPAVPAGEIREPARQPVAGAR